MANKFSLRNKPNKFEDKINKNSNTGCWIFTGSCSANGYGKICVRYKTISTHRYSYIKYVGPIPEGLLVLHKCDTPSCVNPEHLFLGTQSDNMKDMYSKKRFNPSNWSKKAKLKYGIIE